MAAAAVVVAAAVGLASVLGRAPAVGAVQNIVSFGAVANDTSQGAALANGRAVYAAMMAAQAGSGDNRTVWVPPGGVYSMLPAADMYNITDTVLVIDGVLSALTTNLSWWPNNSVTGAALDLLCINWCNNVTISGSGTVEGNGYWWWWYVIVSGHDNRPDLLNMAVCSNVDISGVTWRNSPMYHIFLADMATVRVHDFTVWVDVEEQRALLDGAGHLTRSGDGSGLPAGIPTFPLNTDGVDVSGRDVIVSNLTIQNFDDAVAVKPIDGRGVLATCSSDMLITDIHVIFGVGMTIGSVPPTLWNNCVRNITFQNVFFDMPLKGVYVKTNPGVLGSGIIDSVTYRNLYAVSPLWWGIYIGPQQQSQPGGFSTGCSFLYPLPNTTCPTQPLVPITNIAIINATFVDALLSPGILLCNATVPCTGWTWTNVTSTSVTNWPVTDGFLCTAVEGMNITNSSPVPACAGQQSF